MANELIPQNDAETQFVKLLEAGLVRLDFAQQKIVEMMESTHKAVAGTAPDVVAMDETAKEEPLTAMPFSELANLLTSEEINLEQLLNDHVAFMVRRGIVKETETEQYKAKFNTISVRKQELENIPQGYRPMLFVDNMTPTESAEAFDVPLFGQTLADFTKRDLNTLEPLPNQNPSGLARLTFVPDTANLTSDLTGQSANTRLKQMKQGKRFMEPAQWFQFFAERLEETMKELNLSDKDWKDMTDEEKQAILATRAIDPYLPDLRTWTQFPDYRNKYGRVLGLDFGPGFREVGVGDCDPRDAHDDVGGRPSLG